ncbi:MAG: APC family permease [Gemmatimonadetes bacterium]|nr:APC family permease [Gemmatimonadota bacterium]
MAIDGLKKVLGLSETTFIAIGMTVGGGIFVFTGIVLKIVGPALPIAFALAWIPILISMLPLAMLGAALPTTGGNYKYPSRMVSPGLAFTGIWVYALATFFGQIPLYSITCARYVNAVFPSVSPLAFAAALVTFFCLINVLGVKLAAQAQGVMVVVLVGAILFYGAQGPMHLEPARFEHILQKGTGNLFLGTALLTFTYIGSNGIIELGGEIREPGKVIPRALLITFPVVAVLYLLVAVTTVNAVPWQSLVNVEEPVISTARQTLGHAGFVFFMLGGAVLALTTTLNALFIFGTKSLLVIVDDGLLPRSLGVINRRFGTAHYLFLLVWIISMIGIASGFSLETFASYAALGSIIIFIPVLLAALALPTLYPLQYAASSFKLSGFWLAFCAVVGIAISLFFSLVILIDLKSAGKIALFLVFILSGVVYYVLRARVLRGRGADPALLKAAIKWTD